MKNSLLLFLMLALMGCHRNPTKIANTPLSGMDQFEVTLLFSPSESLDRELFFKTVVSSFEKIGNVHISDGDIYTISNTLPILLLSYGMGGEKTGSMKVFAEAEILINHYRIGSQVWNMDFSFRDRSVVPEMEGDKVVFKEQKALENVSSQQAVEKMIEEFAKVYQDGNHDKPTFHIHSKLI